MIKEQISLGFKRSLATYPSQATVQKQVSVQLATYISQYCGAKHEHILEIGCGTGFLTSVLLRMFPESQWTINDLNSQVRDGIDRMFCQHSAQPPSYVFGDAEDLECLQKYQLMVSSSCFQWFAAPDKFFRKAAESLELNGLLAFSSFGPENMREIKMLSGQGLNYCSLNAYAEMLSDQFEVVWSSEDILRIYFSTASNVLKHIKASGVNGSFRQHWTKAKLVEFSEGYARLKEEKGYPLTYHPIYFIARKR